jgi:uncharacterized OB-fold protein
MSESDAVFDEEWSPKVLLGYLDQLPHWATICSDCGTVHVESVPQCPTCHIAGLLEVSE